VQPQRPAACGEQTPAFVDLVTPSLTLHSKEVVHHNQPVITLTKHLTWKTQDFIHSLALIEIALTESIQSHSSWTDLILCKRNREKKNSRRQVVRWRQGHLRRRGELEQEGVEEVAHGRGHKES
jgi:hypothetical protein